MMEHLLALLTLLPALLTAAGLRMASGREGAFPRLPVRFSTEVAYREGRQCSHGVGGSVWSPPERCALPQDHYGECES